jgi:hypothetical protein
MAYFYRAFRRPAPAAPGWFALDGDPDFEMFSFMNHHFPSHLLFSNIILAAAAARFA